MKRFTVFAAIMLIGCVSFADEATTRPTAIKLGEPMQLWNGKDLDGWVWVQRQPTTHDAAPLTTIENVWSVADSVLRDKGTPVGYIRTTRKFSNFILTVEQRHTAPGNGGILFAISGPDKVWPHCLECQGLVGSEGDLRGIANFKMVSDPHRTEKQRVRRMGDPENPIGEWSTVVITVNRGEISIVINGQLANQAYTSDDLTGYIGLQAEGGPMEFRRIELTPIEQ